LISLRSKYIPQASAAHPAASGIHFSRLFKLTPFVGMAAQEGINAGQASDLAHLWHSAVEDYERNTKKSLRLAQSTNIDQIMNGTEGLSNQFKDFRHDRSKTDNVRTAFKNNLWLIQKVVDTVQVAGNAASVRLDINSVHNLILSGY
jgi:hypothetical protein